MFGKKKKHFSTIDVSEYLPSETVDRIIKGQRAIEKAIFTGELDPVLRSDKQLSLFETVTKSVTIHTFSVRNGYHEDIIDWTEENDAFINKWIDKETNCLYSLILFPNDEPENVYVTRDIFEKLYRYQYEDFKEKEETHSFEFGFNYELNIEYNRLVGKQAKVITNKLARGFVKYCQALKDDCLLSPDDSGLENFWDEICIDTQGEWTVYHYFYEEMVESYVDANIYPKLTELEKTILWTQTNSFNEWIEEIEDNNIDKKHIIFDFFDNYDESAIKNYILDSIWEEATNYTNSRIEKYLYGG